MIANIRESKAKLSELVALASAGEEVLITVRGNPKVRMVAVESSSARKDLKAWAERLRSELAKMPVSPDSSCEIIGELRGERWS